ncbi:hypothetical protein [Hephaestia mangrovi]|uniref:hypothetical protein n=1 Tax=Hephaestia mangrovi TaxID=2873268 RepID=UPI001CA63495|nr:hypothetical protein [Hephaestia mangrovi]MBY8829881.1 hypothetical protein [Hephaestia mangrovi]
MLVGAIDALCGRCRFGPFVVGIELTVDILGKVVELLEGYEQFDDRAVRERQR